MYVGKSILHYENVGRVICLKCDQNPGTDGLIHRTSRMSNTIPGISHFPCAVLLAQHRIEAVFLEEIDKHSTVNILRNVEPFNIETDRSQVGLPMSHAVTVKLKQTTRGHTDHTLNAIDEDPARKQKGMRGDRGGVSQITIGAKYVIGCDGAHSWTRKQLGSLMEGEQTEYVWGVLGRWSNGLLQTQCIGWRS